MPHRPVRAVMHTAVVTLAPDQTAREAEQVLARHRVSGAPVVDAEGRVLGVLSQSDLVRFDADRPSVSAAGTFFSDVDDYRDVGAMPADEGQVRVERIMSRAVISASPDAPLAEVARLLRQRHVHRVLVTENGVLRGIVSALDLLVALEEAAPPGSASG